MSKYILNRENFIILQLKISSDFLMKADLKLKFFISKKFLFISIFIDKQTVHNSWLNIVFK